MKFLQALSIYLPTNEVEREEEKYLGSLQYEPRLVFNIYPGSKKIPMTYRLKLRKHFHRTQANENGENQSYSFKNEIAGESNIFQSNFSAGLILNFGNSWTYSGQPKMKYSTSQFLGYSVNDQSILQIGHLYGDTLYRANEGVFRLKKYNKFDSLFFTNLIMIF